MARRLYRHDETRPLPASGVRQLWVGFMPPAANDNQAPPVLRLVRWALAGLVVAASGWLLLGGNAPF
jgi:hypothetical protein